ncbi:MAG: DUF4390 domain-containing protein [Candidatus Rokubacteria bacterium]|nr:DUF4390 domain-containing protein [Candidatus Rokubacteria bacterium]
MRPSIVRGRAWRWVLVAFLFAGPGSAAVLSAHAAGIRIADLMVTNSEESLGVHAVLLGPIPPQMLEALETGIPATVRFTVELWQYSRFWFDRLVGTKLIERTVTYDVLTKEYRVTAVKGDERPPQVTKTLNEAQRALTMLREPRLVPFTTLKPDELYYVRVRGEMQSAQDSSIVRFLPFVSSGRDESSWERSPLLTIRRGQ